MFGLLLALGLEIAAAFSPVVFGLFFVFRRGRGRRFAGTLRPHLQDVLRVMEGLENEHVGLDRVAIVLFQQLDDRMGRIEHRT